MDISDPTILVQLLVAAAIVGIVGTILILRRERKDSEPPGANSAFATSTEGMSRCPSCGFTNLVSDATCASCGAPLPD